MANFNLDDYEPVADRVRQFWIDHPEGCILTDLVHSDGKTFIVKTTVRITCDPDHLPAATGYAEEVIGSSNVNRTSALENCETSAIGRALANLGYAVKNRASREEMEKVQTRERPRQGGMKRIPGPRTETGVTVTEPPQTPTNGTQAHLTVEQAAKLARIKTELLNRVEGDRGEATRIWSGVLAIFGLDPRGPIPADLLGPIETATLDQFAQDRLLEVPE